MGYAVGVDIGGTFTDCVVIDGDGVVTVSKAPSTPPDFGVGFVDAMREAAAVLGLDVRELVADCRGIYHGCTVGTNALVEGNAAPVGLITTRGHRDSIFFMQSGRRLRRMPAEYIAAVATHAKPQPLVPKHLVAEVDERVAFDGAVLVALDPGAVRGAVQELADAGAQAFAVSLVWATANPAHEAAVAEVVADVVPGAFVSLGSLVAPRVGEYERTVATVVNAAVGPTMDAYLGGLEELLAELGYTEPVQVMTCSGGLIAAQEARRRPVLTIGSGPVAGVIGSVALEQREAQEGTITGPDAEGNVITADMGGTTLDVGVISQGVPLSSPTAWHGQYEYFVPTVDVRSIGAGGGSLVRSDAQAGTLSVGPGSAGARPGPVCYGRGGTRPTVTDADLVLGVMGGGDFAAGTMRLDVAAAAAALAEVGAPLGLDARQTAAAAVRIVDNKMADAIRLASIQQGYDPRRFALYAYGGAGAIHGAAIARELGIGTVVVPLSNLASAWSAFGIVSSDAVVVEEKSVSLREPFPADEVNAHWHALEAAVSERMTRQGIDRDAIVLSRRVDLRYTLQVNQVQVAAPGGEYDAATFAELIATYERDYARLFGEGTGYAAAGYAMTLLRVEGRAPIGDAGVHAAPAPGGGGTTEKGRRAVTFVGTSTEELQAVVHDGARLAPGHAVEGPAILEYPHTSVVVPAGARAAVDPLGSIRMDLRPQGSGA
ncbi:hydantoinase/oxoprolinase family protein [Baekduia soli]|uniref:Hydantoinase/oxoprolinase family protein n=1 Tax=Baekduia soli TaxID=496014 RepID=A0A5B8U3I4_9ACTN|nr:hydantoinase/oxoprolinase family protein [Baekduia soli]QEC47491.1 hydantoinase/oxoprolinase family protein [Baekduia soli]